MNNMDEIQALSDRIVYLERNQYIIRKYFIWYQNIVEEYKKEIESSRETVRICRNLLSRMEKQMEQAADEIDRRESGTESYSPILEPNSNSVDRLFEEPKVNPTKPMLVYVRPGVTNERPCVRLVTPEKLLELRKTYGEENVFVSGQTGDLFHLVD